MTQDKSVGPAVGRGRGGRYQDLVDSATVCTIDLGQPACGRSTVQVGHRSPPPNLRQPRTVCGHAPELVTVTDYYGIPREFASYLQSGIGGTQTSCRIAFMKAND